MPAPRAVAFDFNGTLSRDEPIMYAIYRDIFGARGRPISEAEYYGQLAGLSEEAIIAGWLGVEDEELDELVAERVRRYLELASDGATVPVATRDALAYAAARVPVAVVSGAFRREIEPVLAAAGLTRHVRVLVAADDVERGKPHPEGYALTLALLGRNLRPEDVLAFEDTEAGVAAAKDAGLRCVGIRGTVAPDRLGRADELVDLIDVELMQRLLG
jgi:beta-phosphoglucomutase